MIFRMRHLLNMRSYENTKQNVSIMLANASKHEDQWESRVSAIDSDSRIYKDYCHYLLSLWKEFSEKRLSLRYGRYLFDQWGNYSAEPEHVDYMEVTADGVRCMWCVPHDCVESRVIIACHGGAYTYGSIYSHRKCYAHLAVQTNCRVLMVDYGRIPEVAWPQPLEDVITVYKWLLDSGISNDHIAITGDSCGGAMAVSLPLKCKERRLPMVAAVMPISPWGDLEAATPVYDTNHLDLLNNLDMVRLGGSILALSTDLRNPEVAPIYIENFRNYPPMYLQVGGYENFADDARIIAGKAYEHGVDVKCEFVENMQHCFHQMAGYSKDADLAIKRLAEWVMPILGI